jgi:hypothetical protein
MRQKWHKSLRNIRLEMPSVAMAAYNSGRWEAERVTALETAGERHGARSAFRCSSVMYVSA